MAQRKIYEGTLEEITAQFGLELRGRHLRILVDDVSASVRRHFADASPTEWVRALSDWASGHIPNPAHLSDEAISRESIYEGRG